MKKMFLVAVALALAPVSVFAKGGTVSAADPRAAAAGQQILREGGSAADAAMAMMLALTVVEPQSSGIGGGGFIVYHDSKRGKVATIDGRETAPAAATPSLFLDDQGKSMGFREAVPGGRSVGVPGNIALMARTHAKWGKLKWEKLFEPAIRLADNGYQVTPRLANSLKLVAPIWRDFPSAQAIYWQDGRAKAVGETVKNPALAALLRMVAAKGPRAFYSGENAKAIVAATTQSKRNPAAMTLKDLAAYRAKPRDAVCAPYRTYKLCGMGPPSSGATTVFQILGMLERFDMKALGKDSPQSWHLIGEAMLLAYADREKYLGDADFVKVPVTGLLNKSYVASRSALISPTSALGSYGPGTPPGAPARTAAVQNEVPSTTHFVAVDGSGNIASMTSTVEGPFGSQLVVNGYVLNNELTDFTFAPEKDGAPVANRVQGGKRPLSSMSPTIVYNASGKPVFAVGAAGGKTIIMQVAKTLIAHLDWGLSAADALATANIYYTGNTIVIEGGTSVAAMAPQIAALGQTVLTRDQMPAKANAAELTADGWRGAADPRSEGEALSID